MSARRHNKEDALLEGRVTPMQFAEAVWRGCLDFSSSAEEAQAAIFTYTEAYEWVVGTHSWPRYRAI